MYMSAQLACKYSTLPRQKVHTGASMPHHASKQQKVHTPRAPPPESWRHPWENSISSFRKRKEDSPRCFKNQVPSGKLTWQPGKFPFYVGNTSSFQVHFLLLCGFLPECTSSNLKHPKATTNLNLLHLVLKGSIGGASPTSHSRRFWPSLNQDYRRVASGNSIHPFQGGFLEVVLGINDKIISEISVGCHSSNTTYYIPSLQLT